MLRCIRFGATVVVSTALAFATVAPGGSSAQTHRVSEYSGWWYAAQGARYVPVHLYLRVNLQGRVEVMQPTIENQHTEFAQLRATHLSPTLYAFDFGIENGYEPQTHRYTCTIDIVDVNRVTCEDHQALRGRAQYSLYRCVCASCARPCQ